MSTVQAGDKLPVECEEVWPPWWAPLTEVALNRVKDGREIGCVPGVVVSLAPYLPAAEVAL